MGRGTRQGLGFAAAVVAAALLVACPSPEEPACPVGQVQDADTDECVPEHCGAESWGLIERTGETIHVAPWGDDGWDGSGRWPYRSIQHGADEADGGLLAVAAGTYVENLELDGDHDGVEIAGRCAELVTIDGSAEEEPGVLVTRGGLKIRSVTVTGGQMGVLVHRVGFGAAPEVDFDEVVLVRNEMVGLAVDGTGAAVRLVRSSISEAQPTDYGNFGFGIQISSGASLFAQGLLLQGSHDVGLHAANAATSVELDDVTIRDTQPRADGLSGAGIDLQDGASLIAGGLLLERNHDVGLLAGYAGTSVELDDVTIRDTQPLPDGTGGRGICVQEGASLVARGLLVEENHDVGLLATNAGTSVDLEDATIRSTQPLPDGTRGKGVVVQEGASLVARGLLLEGNHDSGLLAVDVGTSVDLEDATVRDTQPRTDGTFGRGIGVQAGASLVARGLLLGGNHEFGLSALGAGTSVDLSDVTIRDTQPRTNGTFGNGIGVQDGASLVARGLALEGNHEFGLFAAEAGTSVDLEDATVRDTQPRTDGTSGTGIEVSRGASLVARNLLLEGNHDSGLFAVNAGTSVDLEDATIRDTQPPPDGTNGRGIDVQDGASLVARGLLLEGNHEIGLLAGHAGTSVNLEDVRIAGTRTPVNCAGGMGIAVQQGASVTTLGLLVEDNEGPGVYVVRDGTLEAGDVALQRNGFAGAVVVDRGSLTLNGGTVTGSVSHSSEAGRTGIFAWNDIAPPHIELDGVTFSDLIGPALYLRGPGRYVMRDCVIKDTGTWPWLPGGVFAAEGVQPWYEVGNTGYFNGLLLEGNTFSDLSGDAILLDSSSATLDLHPETGAANTFTNLDGVSLVWQRCDDVSVPEILDGSVSDPTCEPEPRTLGPLLDYYLWLTETEPLE